MRMLDRVQYVLACVNAGILSVAILAILTLAGCASYGEPYGGDGYRGTVTGRDGSEWYRCRVRDGYPAWCRAN